MKNIRATERHFSFLASCVTGYDVTVNITGDPSYVGFTQMPSNGKANITLSYATRLYEGFSERKTLVMMLGVLAHECLHLCYTDFDAYNAKTVVLSRKIDKEAFHEINNVVEDPAIEFAATSKIGGKMLKALSAIIKHTWMTAPNIEENIPQGKESSYAYTQVIRAMIQLGDRGILKGKFLSKTAEDAFAEVLPLFNAAIVEPDGNQRVNYSVEIYKILRPLIHKEAEETQKSLNKATMLPMPDAMGDGEPTGELGEPLATASLNGQQTQAQKQQELRKKLEQKLAGKTSDETNRKDVNNQDVEKARDSSNESEQHSSQSQTHGQHAAQDDVESNKQRPYDPSSKDVNDLTAMDEDMEFSEEDFASLQSEIEQVETQIQISEKAEQVLTQKSTSELPMNSDVVINTVANNPDESRYNAIVAWYSSKISTLTNELRKIFSSDYSKVKNASHGSRINAKRLVDGKLHSNILLSRSKPKDLDDMAVYILIDKSGSMSKNNGKGKNNDQCAAETAICLYEALQNLRIPVYITGFTTRGNKALHVHYVTWNSPNSHKYTIANFSADDANYDYYSIMEATNILKKHSAKHKLLIVISDGAPCNVRGGQNSLSGVMATAAAVTQARKTADVLGVAMNCYDEELYATMYGKDYITVSTANDMFLPISETLQKIVKSW